MAHWYESSIDRQLREAAERGEFDNLPGAGRPLPGHGKEYEDDWWVKDWLQREGANAAVIPPTLGRHAAQRVERRHGPRCPSGGTGPRPAVSAVCRSSAERAACPERRAVRRLR